jgi:hypothetical protein
LAIEAQMVARPHKASSTEAATEAEKDTAQPSQAASTAVAPTPDDEEGTFLAHPHKASREAEAATHEVKEGESRVHVQNTSEHATEDGKCDGHQPNTSGPAAAHQTAGGYRHSSGFRGLLLHKALTLYRGWRTYASYRVALAGLALAFLYMTVLSFHSITVGECRLFFFLFTNPKHVSISFVGIWNIVKYKSSLHFNMI